MKDCNVAIRKYLLPPSSVFYKCTEEVLGLYRYTVIVKGQTRFVLTNFYKKNPCSRTYKISWDDEKKFQDVYFSFLKWRAGIQWITKSYLERTETEESKVMLHNWSTFLLNFHAKSSSRDHFFSKEKNPDICAVSSQMMYHWDGSRKTLKSNSI